MSHPKSGQSSEDRFLVQTSDGTPIPVWIEGSGPPLVLVHGALSDHTTFARLVAELRDRVTTFAMDRRGRGATGEVGGEYSIEREFEDVAAVVAGVAARTGEPVALWGYSYGANCAMGGAALTDEVHHLVVYEPGLGTPYQSGSIEDVEDAVAAGDRERAVVALLLGILEMSSEEVEFMRASPLWPTRLGNVGTVPRELRAEDGWVYRPGQFDAIDAPALVLAGSESPPIQEEATRRAVSAMPNARLRVLDGHGHIAHQTDPALVAGIILEFISS
ncbi:MAG TPA: alpha/beta hydrolase [Acidimicrobiia bacterium]|nr:alpha/beta hydrolase [Acidimicrobiia bacterium]